MGVSSSESHDLTAFYEMLTASFGVLSQNTGFYPSLDRIVETTLGPLNMGPGGGSYNEPISRLHRLHRTSIIIIRAGRVITIDVDSWVDGHSALLDAKSSRRGGQMEPTHSVVSWGAPTDSILALQFPSSPCSSWRCSNAKKATSTSTPHAP